MTSQLYAWFSFPIKKCLFWLAGRIKTGPTQKTIHIVRLDAIGDFVLFSAILPYFRKLYPDYKIVLIVDEVVKDLALWLNGHNYFDELISIDGKEYNRNFFYYYQTLKKIRLFAPKIVVQPTFSRTTKSDDIVFISKEAQKIAYEGDFSNIRPVQKKKNNTKYSRLIKNPAMVSEPEINKHFINQLAGFEMLSMGAPHWEISEQLKAEMKKKLESMGVDVAKHLVAVCPGSSRKIKNWPATQYVSLMLKLSEWRPDLQFILIGGDKEKELCVDIQKRVDARNIHNICGQANLPKLAAILSMAKLYIGSDTGALHMASAVGVPAVGIMSGEHGSRFFPYPAWRSGAQNVAVFSKIPGGGVKSIPVDDVFNEAVKLLKGVEK